MKLDYQRFATHKPLPGSSPICLISLIFDFFFFFGCGSVGGGVLVVSVLCGGGFCVDSGRLSVGASV